MLLCCCCLTLRTSNSFGPDSILYPPICHVCVLQPTNALSVENVFGGFCVDGQHCSVTYPRSHSNNTIPLESDAPIATAYNCDFALLLAMICCLRVYVFDMWLPINITLALDDVRVS